MSHTSHPLHRKQPGQPVPSSRTYTVVSSSGVKTVYTGFTRFVPGIVTEDVIVVLVVREGDVDGVFVADNTDGVRQLEDMLTVDAFPYQTIQLRTL